VAENRQELEREIQTLEGLIRQARAIIQSGEEVKLRHFREALTDLDRQHPGSKILIFTEARDTLEYLESRIRDWGYSICTIHGGMRLEERICCWRPRPVPVAWPRFWPSWTSRWTRTILLK